MIKSINKHCFDRYRKQQRSKPIGLEKGRVYYMEAYLKEGGGGDHLTVRVKLPSGSAQTPLMKNLYTRSPVRKLPYNFHTILPYGSILIKFVRIDVPLQLQIFTCAP